MLRIVYWFTRFRRWLFPLRSAKLDLVLAVISHFDPNTCGRSALSAEIRVGNCVITFGLLRTFLRTGAVPVQLPWLLQRRLRRGLVYAAAISEAASLQGRERGLRRHKKHRK